jgi:hypothetical protein
MPLTYSLAPRAVVARARVVALTGTAMAVAPAWLVVVLVAQLRLAPLSLSIGIGLAIALLGIARGAVELARAKRRLTELAIEIDGDELVVCTARARTRVPPGSINQVTEIDGTYGGLRVALSAPGLPPRFDIPRGGDSFADLRAWLVARAPLVRPPRRARSTRIAIGAAVVLGLFFVPFVVADARGSRLAVALVLLLAWGGMRAIAAARA